MVGISVAANAQTSLSYLDADRSVTRSDFAFPDGGAPSIVIMRPEVFVGEQSTGGLDRVNADWTEAAKAGLLSSLRQQLSRGGFQVSLMPELEGEDARLEADYRALFQIVATAAVENSLWPVDALPTKEKDFDWSLGPGTEALGRAVDAQYGLFIYSYDSFSLPGRRALELIGIAAGAEEKEPPHIGYAGLVDLSNGNLVWLNVNVRLDGDIRRANGLNNRARQLLAGFPPLPVGQRTAGKD